MTMNLPLSSDLGLRLTNFCESMGKELVGRCIKVYRFEPHPRRKILMILGEVTITAVVSLSGKVEKQWTEDFKKPIHLLGLSRSSKPEKVARDIMTNCPFIDLSQINNLSEAIKELQERDYDNNEMVIQRQIATDGTFLPRYPEIFDEFDIAEGMGYDMIESEPDFGKLDHYIELLYEDIPQKIEASNYLAKLTKSNTYLRHIAQHEFGINALFRTLREDSKKSMQLTKNILTVCLTLARIKEFQIVLIKHKIPMLALDIIDFELERCEKWKGQLVELETSTAEKKNLSSKTLNEYQTMWNRLDELTRFQNSLLKVAFDVLHCMSEDKVIREKLLHHKVVTSLAGSLEKVDNELLEVVISYLKNLSCFRQYVEEMVALGVVDRIAKMFKEGTAIPKKIVSLCLHLLYNLSFSSAHRERILNSGLISVIMASCFGKTNFQEITCKLLYILSMEPAARPKLAKLNTAKQLMDYLTTSEAGPVPKTWGSLAVNISRESRVAKLMLESNKVGLLVKKSIGNNEFLGMKIIRNLAEQDVAFALNEFVGDIAEAIVTSGYPEFITECVGTLASIDMTKVDIESITQKGRIFPWLIQTVACYLEQSKKSQLEVTADFKRKVSDVILLLANLSSTVDGARYIVEQGLADILLNILHSDPKTNSKIMEHIFSVFKKCAEHTSISELFTTTRIPSGLLEFAESANGQLKELSISVLEQIGKCDPTWKENIQQFHFLAWNKEWTDAVTLEEEESQDQLLEMHEHFYHSDSNPLSRMGESFTDSETEDLGSDQWNNESGLDCIDGVNSNMFGDYGMFQQQFEEDMAVKRLGLSLELEQDDFSLDDDDLFDYASDTDSGWQYDNNE